MADILIHGSVAINDAGLATSNFPGNIHAHWTGIYGTVIGWTTFNATAPCGPLLENGSIPLNNSGSGLSTPTRTHYGNGQQKDS